MYVWMLNFAKVMIIFIKRVKLNKKVFIYN